MTNKSENNYYQQHLTFSEIVEAVLKFNGFELEDVPKGNRAYDYIGTLDKIKVFIEIKSYSTKYPQLDLLKNAYQRLSDQKEKDTTRLLLIVSSFINPSLKEEIFNESGVIVWDASSLLTLAYNFSSIYVNLATFLSDILNSPIGEPLVVDSKQRELLIDSLKTTNSDKKKTPIKSRGKNLCDELNKLSAGKKDATKFEDKCIDILKYLFDNNIDLALWEKQPTTDDSLHRFDLLCRIISSTHNNFWTQLSNDFHTRYVLFEFKNYSDKIKQGQIYTTEKYLFLTALRSVSFIIAKNGFDVNSMKAAKGALKEAGKLIVILTPKDLCEMLTLKDNGDEPEQILRQKIDQILVTLTR